MKKNIDKKAQMSSVSGRGAGKDLQEARGSS
jgi:hypothetical protein